MKIKNDVLQSLQSIFEDDAEKDEKGRESSYYLGKALYHLKEVSSYLNASTDPKIKNDIGEEAFKIIRDINVHGDLAKIQKALTALQK
jgi:hypothetical protein